MLPLFLFNTQDARPIQIDLTQPGIKRSYEGEPGRMFSTPPTPSPYHLEYGLTECVVSAAGSVLFTLAVTNVGDDEVKVPVSLDQKTVYASGHHERVSWVVEAQNEAPPGTEGVIRVLQGSREDGEYSLRPAQTIAVRFLEIRPTLPIKAGDRLALTITENRLRDDRFERQSYSVLPRFLPDQSASCK